MGNIQRYTPVTLYPKEPPYNKIIIVDAILRQLRARHTSTVRNVKIAIFENIVLLLHPHVEVPYSWVVT